MRRTRLLSGQAGSRASQWQRHQIWGVLYTDYASLSATTPVSALWSYETCERSPDRRSVTLRADGNREYWLDRSDPLLNTILPGTGISLILNCGDSWTAGRSPLTSDLMPRLCVVGPVTEPRILRVGRMVKAIGAGVLPTMTPAFFGVPASLLVDRMVPLDELWTQEQVERLVAHVSDLDIRSSLSRLRDELVSRIARAQPRQTVAESTVRLIKLHAGRLSIDNLARSQGLTRQLFARRFRDAAGLSPKLFARITRFQALVPVLLSTEVSTWAAEATAVGFYDQAHMINEFRAFAGSAPTVFFRPDANVGADRMVQLRGRPSDWRQPSHSATSPPSRPTWFTYKIH